MTGLFERQRAPAPHLPEDVLTRLVCQELSPARRWLANRHLRRCHPCRARVEQLERTSLGIMEYRDDVLKKLGPLSVGRRDLFIEELGMVLEATPPRPWWKRLQQQFGVLPTWISLPSLKSVMVMICTALILFSVWRWQLSSVSAAEFLDRAVASERSPVKVAGSGVIHKRFRVKAGMKTIEHDSYRDTSGRLQSRNDNIDIGDADLAIRLALAGVNWDDPLSAVSFKSWHDRQTNPKDEIHASGQGLLTISTRLPSTIIAEESLTVREDGFQPIVRTIEYRDFGTVEISEVSLEFLSGNNTSQSFYLPKAAVKAAAPRVPAATPAPSLAQMDETELEARLMLNQKSADTGEQVEITRDVKGVKIEGLVESEARKKELTQSLQAIPFLSVRITSVDELGSTRDPDAQIMPTQQKSWVAKVSPLEQYFVRHGRSRDDLSRISAGLFNCSLAINRSSRSISQIVVRFSADEELSQAAMDARDELLSRTLERLLDDLTEQQNLLDEANLAYEPEGTGSMNPSADNLDLAHLGDLNMALTTELMSGAGESSRSEKTMAAELSQTISQLRIAALNIIPGRSNK
jgi:hypothetical protein